MTIEQGTHTTQGNLLAVLRGGDIGGSLFRQPFLHQRLCGDCGIAQTTNGLLVHGNGDEDSLDIRDDLMLPWGPF